MSFMGNDGTKETLILDIITYNVSLTPTSFYFRFKWGERRGRTPIGSLSGSSEYNIDLMKPIQK